MIGYFVWVAIGILAAFVARRLQGPQSALDPRERTGLLLVAIGGAILGAYGLQLPADVFGWRAEVPGVELPVGVPLGGRTVLGGLIGGWLAVELGKRAFGIRTATGDEFALPLAVALLCGRVGCLSAGCCGGRECADGWFAHVDALGVPRVPVQALEIAFHALAALLLVGLARRGAFAGRRLALYLTAYALVRFLLEFERTNPRVALGLTWHQFLATALFALAGATLVARSLRPCAAPRPAP